MSHVIFKPTARIELVTRAACVCGRGRYCVCWEGKLHANPQAVKMRGRDGSMAVTVPGEEVARALLGGRS